MSIANNTTINLFSLSICSEVKIICEPLFKHTKVIAFLYTELFPDGSRAEVGSHHDHLKLTYVDTRHMHQVHTAEFLPKSNVVFVPEWIESTNNRDLTAQFKNQANYLGIGNELCLIKRTKINYEYYHFYAAAKDSEIYCFYLDKLSVLKHFCLYFRNRAAELIQHARNNKIVKPWRNIGQLKIEPINSSLNDFLQETKIERFYLDESLNSYLTEREVQCAIQFLSNKSSQEIGKALNLSPRTVENYLANIKDKLCCHKRSELINKLSELELQYIVTNNIV